MKNRHIYLYTSAGRGIEKEDAAPCSILFLPVMFGCHFSGCRFPLPFTDFPAAVGVLFYFRPRRITFQDALWRRLVTVRPSTVVSLELFGATGSAAALFVACRLSHSSAMCSIS